MPGHGSPKVSESTLRSQLAFPPHPLIGDVLPALKFKVYAFLDHMIGETMTNHNGQIENFILEFSGSVVAVSHILSTTIKHLCMLSFKEDNFF